MLLELLVEVVVVLNDGTGTSSEGRMKAGVKCLRSWLKTGIIGEVLGRSWVKGGGV